MADDLVVSGVHPPGERSAGDPLPVPDKLTVDSFAAKISVQWAPQEAVTPLGQLPFFIDFLKQSDLFDQLVREAPLSYTSPNAPRPRDVLGTLVLSMVAGGAALRACERAALRRSEPATAGDGADVQRRLGAAGGGAAGVQIHTILTRFGHLFSN